MEQENKLEVMIRDSGLDLQSTKAKMLLEQFSDYFDIAADWEKKAATIIVNNANQTAEMKMAREGRLFLRQKRIAIEKKRKELKEQALREGRAIDGMANILKALIVPIEEYLDKQEHYVEIKQAEEVEKKRLEAERKAEEDRIAKEKAEKEEQERIRNENKRLQKEAEEKERELQKERAAAEAEKRKQEQALAAAKMKADAERKRIEAEHERERQKIAAEKLKMEQRYKRKTDRLQKKLANQITCPHCGGKLYPDGTKVETA